MHQEFFSKWRAQGYSQDTPACRVTNTGIPPDAHIYSNHFWRCQCWRFILWFQNQQDLHGSQYSAAREGRTGNLILRSLKSCKYWKFLRSLMSFRSPESLSSVPCSKNGNVLGSDGFVIWKVIYLRTNNILWYIKEGRFLYAVASLVLTHSQAHKNSSHLIGCCIHVSFLLVDVIPIAVEHSTRFLI